MDIDIHALKALEREREIPFDILVDAIEAALAEARPQATAPAGWLDAEAASGRCAFAARADQSRARAIGSSPGHA